MNTYFVSVDDEVRLMFEADFTNPSCSLLIDGGVPTPFTVADAEHSRSKAVHLINNWLRQQEAEAFAETECWRLHHGLNQNRPILYRFADHHPLRNATQRELRASEAAAEQKGGLGVIQVLGQDCYVLS